MRKAARSTVGRDVVCNFSFEKHLFERRRAMQCKFSIQPPNSRIESIVTILLDDGKDASFTFKGAINTIGILSEFLRRAAYAMEQNFNSQPTAQACKPETNQASTH
jgi:hypothetical protein